MTGNTIQKASSILQSVTTHNEIMKLPHLLKEPQNNDSTAPKQIVLNTISPCENFNHCNAHNHVAILESRSGRSGRHHNAFSPNMVLCSGMRDIPMPVMIWSALYKIILLDLESLVHGLLIHMSMTEGDEMNEYDEQDQLRMMMRRPEMRGFSGDKLRGERPLRCRVGRYGGGLNWLLGGC